MTDFHHPPSLRQRIVEGTITYNDPNLDIVHIQLDNCPWAELARVRKETLPPDVFPDECRPGNRMKVFLLGPSKNRDFYHANARWSDETKNPWFTHPPRKGVQTTGTAKRYDQSRNVVYIRLDAPYQDIDAALHIKGLPPDHDEDITRAVDIGDRYPVEIIDVLPDLLQVDVSVNRALLQLAKEESSRRFLDHSKSMVEIIDPQAWYATIAGKSESIRIGLLGPNNYFNEHLRLWLASWDVNANILKDIYHLERILRASNRPEHLLVATSQWQKDAKKNQVLTQILAEYNVKIVWLIDEEPLFSLIPGPQLTLPIHVSDLVHALREDGNNKTTHILPKAHHFQDFQRSRVQNLASELLAEICHDNSHIHAAMWVAKDRPGAYSIRAYHGLNDDAVEQVQPVLGQTFFHITIEMASSFYIPSGSTGPLRLLIPDAANHVYFHPVSFKPSGSSEESIERAIAFFVDATKPGYYGKNEISKRIEKYLPRMQLLVEMLLFATHNEMLSVLADVGRNSVSYLHEVAVLADALNRRLQGLQSLFKLFNTDNSGKFSQEMRKLTDDTNILLKLARSDLSQIQISRTPRLPVRTTLERGVELYAYRFNPMGGDLQLQVPDLPLTLSLPPMVLEQALRNLLDNSAYFLGFLPKGSGRVQVMVSMNLNDPLTPLYVDVVDNGPGVRAGIRQNLFRPRHTEKGDAGTGMGLYLARNLLLGYGGDLELIESVRWQRTCFRIKLPVVLDNMTQGTVR
ncbi:MAG: hypothetical protein HQL81_01205 [Magnetococcales bacterium]|nr:hypothetical protein [Magnetococcales bacterium]